jgi:hypothetical protein
MGKKKVMEPVQQSQEEVAKPTRKKREEHELL